jgi:5-methylcytosine-specific restriction endonuclease McrA
VSGDWGGWRATRYTRAILERDGHICAWCGGWATTAEHVVARSLGGDPWDLENGVAACLSCNSSRGNRPRPVGRVIHPSRQWGQA